MRGRKLVFTIAAATLVFGIRAIAPGASPDASAIQDDSDGMTSGAFYGTTEYRGAHACGVVYKLDATGLTVLHDFNCHETDGGAPLSGVIHDAAGNLYGTASCCGGPGSNGVVYKLDSMGNETVLHHFTGNPDGTQPVGGVILDPAGNLHGTTELGGVHGIGIVFQLGPGAGYVATSFAFTSGAYPDSGFIRGSAGNLYGTTSNGGAFGSGTVYKVDPAGTETVLYSFGGGTGDGFAPKSGLTRDSAGNLYGTTSNGGAFGSGTVYKVDPAGTETVLYNFTGHADGNGPVSGVIFDSAGNLYGTTQYGGTHGFGVVYKLDSTGHETVLHNFTGGADGANPTAGVILDSAGNLYGTTYDGGSADGGSPLAYGVVYKLGPERKKLTVLHTFTGGADGANPYAGVILRRQ